MHELDLALVGIAAVAGGFVNALAGGGTLITFPMLTAVSVPPVAANVTNTVTLRRIVITIGLAVAAVYSL